MRSTRTECSDTEEQRMTSRGQPMPIHLRYPHISKRLAMRTNTFFLETLARFACMNTMRFWGERRQAAFLGIGMSGSLGRTVGGGLARTILATFHGP